MRAVASFLAYINAITPPDAKSPSIADAIAGLKLGKAFRDLGAKTGREAIRALPMAVADLVAEVFEDEAIRGPLATRGVLYTATGPWAAGSAAVFLMDSAGNDGGAPGQSTIARGGSGALASALEAGAKAFGVEIRTGAEVAEIRSRDGRVVGVTLADGESIDARDAWSRPPTPSGRCRLVRPGRARTDHGLAGRQHPPAGRDRQGEPGALRRLRRSTAPTTSSVCAGRIVIGTSIDHVERAKDAWKFGHVAEEPWLEATIPTLADPSLAPEGKHVMSVLVEAAPRHLRDGDWSHGARPARRRHREDARAVRARSRRADRGAAGDHARGLRDRATG